MNKLLFVALCLSASPVAAQSTTSIILRDAAIDDKTEKPCHYANGHDWWRKRLTCRAKDKNGKVYYYYARARGFFN